MLKCLGHTRLAGLGPLQAPLPLWMVSGMICLKTNVNKALLGQMCRCYIVLLRSVDKIVISVSLSPQVLLEIFPQM